MKKFLVFCVSIIVTVSLGFIVYFFTLNNEEIHATQSVYQLNVGDTVSFELERVNAKKETKISYVYDKDGIVEINEKGDTLTALAEGSTRITVNSTNKDIGPVFIDVFVGGGSVANPFFIKNQNDLSRIGKDGDVFTLNSNYKLVNDINVTNDTNLKPIGANGNSPKAFNGKFDGMGKTISNLNFADEAYSGLFANIGTNGQVYNLVLSNVNISGNNIYSGSVAGVNNGLVRDCYVASGALTSSYSGESVIGGVVGNNQSLSTIASIYKCLSNVTITSNKADKIGGIAGQNEGAEINYCYTDLDTSLTGATNTYVGGIAGFNTYSTSYASVVAGCYVLGQISGENNDVHGGIVGVNYFDSSVTIEKTNKIYGNYYVDSSFAKGVGNFADVANATDTPNADYGIYGVESRSMTDMCVQNTYKLLRNAKTDSVVSWDFNNVWIMPQDSTPKFNVEGSSFVSNGRGLLILPGQIMNATKLAEIKDGDSCEIAQDIDMGGIEWNPLNLTNVTLYGSESFKEENGRYPSIYNFKIKNGENVGFFGTLENSSISNINFEQVQNVSDTFADVSEIRMGVIAGTIGDRTVLNNVSVKNQVTESNSTLSARLLSGINTAYVGGLVGVSNGGIINSESNSVVVNIANDSNAESQSYVGGVVGSLANSNAVNDSTATNFRANIANSYNSAAGGIVGLMNESTRVVNSKVYDSNIVASLDFTGKQGEFKGHSEGSIAGKAENSTEIVGSGAKNVSVQGFVIGGIVGDTKGRVQDCYTNSNLTGFKVGGVAGFQQSASRINNVRVDGNLANPISDASYNFGDKSIFSRSAEKAGCVCITFGSNEPWFENIFVNCTFADDGKSSYRTTATLKDNKNAGDLVDSGNEKNIVYNNSKCQNAKERGIVDGSIVGAIGDFLHGKTTVSSYKTTDEDINAGNYEVFTTHDYSVEHWLFTGYPTIKNCAMNIFEQNA